MTVPLDLALADIREGRPVVLVGSSDRPMAGALFVAAQHASPASINLMARHARGLICLALTVERAWKLGLQRMEARNRRSQESASTVSIEAREGVTTGISAFDRARTIATALDPEASAGDLVTPGHVFPLVAESGGVLQHAGYTEAAVDLAFLAGMTPAGVICEILDEQGNLAGPAYLEAFAVEHDMHIVQIADVIAACDREVGGVASGMVRRISGFREMARLNAAHVRADQCANLR
ncbi:3,4-dihydroxy-2-butanone-4-phosphate synthase [Novosphingobium lindaniclasticum]|uniref:3,4-dihydroxy-2-butanone 4-phosphate synthase n=1 Tax=Novosphingobium lindaniclasticum LE124 TaxID=1096930 RepID=T0HQ89_9SPHN|nr:3,4-dihydroxy-2-butanone-4-phosphate synthase [Novosphingobium lindaniclasticum]EQB14298.1 hypothetical protein L284_12955 [Novosphingobium lindaniclasticum LE124]